MTAPRSTGGPAGPGELTKLAAAEAALDALPAALTIAATGYLARIAGERDEPRVLPMTGSMGLALPVATGVALATGRQVLVLDGDGAVMMNPGGILALADLPPLPIVHLVIDDGVYASTGGQRTPGGVNLMDLAQAAGIEGVEVGSLSALVTTLQAAAGRRSPLLVHCRVRAEAGAPAGRVRRPLTEIAARFRQAAAPSPSSSVG